jgi:hypothetical protein
MRLLFIHTFQFGFFNEAIINAIIECVILRVHKQKLSKKSRMQNTKTRNILLPWLDGLGSIKCNLHSSSIKNNTKRDIKNTNNLSFSFLPDFQLGQRTHNVRLDT